MMMDMIDSNSDLNNDHFFKKFLDERNIKKTTQNNYKYHLRYYCQLINKTPKELIEDARKEEDNGIKMRNRKIRRYLKSFQNHYQERNFSPAHINIGMSMIRSFYKFFGIELPQTQRQQDLVDDDSRDKEDLLTIEEIQKALEIASPTYKAIILLIVSSGMGRAEIISLTVQDFINSISKYFDKPLTLPLDIGWIRQKLDKINAPIATWNIHRIKTSGKFTTFSTPESIFAILNYLEEHPPESMDRKLFIPHRYKAGKLELNPSAFSYTFKRINNKCGFPQVGRMGKFRSNNLRKFFASQMMNTSLSQQSIDWMLGHIVKNTVGKAKFKPDPELLRLEYSQVMETVTIINKVVIVKVTEIKVDAMEREMESLRQNNEYLMENYDKMRNKLDKYISYYEEDTKTYTTNGEPDLRYDEESEKLTLQKPSKKPLKKEKYITY